MLRNLCFAVVLPLILLTYGNADGGDVAAYTADIRSVAGGCWGVALAVGFAVVAGRSCVVMARPWPEGARRSGAQCGPTAVAQSSRLWKEEAEEVRSRAHQDWEEDEASEER